jgi:uncharacterized protein YjbI with pentapeptide repeats
MKQEQTGRWRSIMREVPLYVWIVGGSVLVVLVLVSYYYKITLWDWAQLLIVPAVLAGGGIWFNQRQQEREHKIETRRARETALQSYLDQMSQLLIDKEGTQLQQLEPSSDVRRLVTARTVTTLNMLDDDTKRKETVIRYLAEAHLIADKTPIVGLEGADLRHLDLSGLDLSKGNLANADLRGAKLECADLRGTDLHGADLSIATHDGTVTVTNLRGANLSVAHVADKEHPEAPTNLRGAKLRGANLGPPDEGNVTNLSGAILDSADLSPGEDGIATNLTNAILTNATLLDTNLKDAVLYLANLSDAKLTNRQELQHEREEWTARWDDPRIQQTPPPQPELREAEGLTQEQINKARGNAGMVLPSKPKDLELPPLWSKENFEQKSILKHQYSGQ